jgi:hypothetical protein
MPQLSRLLLATTLLSGLAFVPAFAGFTLVAPDAPAAPQEMAAPPSTAVEPVQPPQNTVNRMRVGPDVIELSPVPTMAAPVPAPVVAAPAAVAAPAPAPKMPLAAPVAVLEKPVRGFGKDIPLVIAAQQIAPADRQIAFSPGVDPSMPVTWKGGQTWRTVLADALSSRGLQVAEQGNILFISQSNSMVGAQKASLLNNRPKAQMEAQEAVTLSPPPAVTAIAPQPQPMPQPMMQPAPEMVTLPSMVMPPAAPAEPAPAMVASQPVIPTMAPAPAPVVQPVMQPVMQPQYAQPAMMAQQQPMMQPVAQPARLPEPVLLQPSVQPPMQPPVQSMAPAPQPMPQPVMQPVAAPVVSAPAPVSTLPDITQPAPMAVEAAFAEPSFAAPKNEKLAEVLQWNASPARSLKQTLESWSDRAGVTLRWDSEFDYPVQANVNVEGDYETAVRTLLRGFSSAQPQPVARLYRPTQGAPGVLLVTARGNDISRGK